MFKKIQKWCYRKKAIFGLRKKYRLEMAVDEVLKDWITACIIDRKQEGRRQELIDSQKKLKEEELFYKWLMNLK